MTISVEIDGKLFDHVIEGNSELAEPIYTSVLVRIMYPLTSQQTLEKSIEEVQTIRSDHSVFGKSLNSVMNAQKTKSKELNIPEVVHQAIHALLLRGEFSVNFQ